MTIEREKILDEIHAERLRQIDTVKHGGDTDEFDKDNTRNDWVSFIAAYAGRAGNRCGRNEREGLGFRRAMIIVAAIAMAAIEAHDAGYC